MAGILPVVMGFRHSGFEASGWFEETLIHGPLRRFVHRHEFEARGTATLVRDVVSAELPSHFGGALAMRVAGGQALRNLFARRSAALVRLAQTGVIGSSRPVPIS